MSRAMYNSLITIKSNAAGTDDSSGNKTYSSASLLTNEQARKYEITRNKLTDEGTWLSVKFTNFDIFDVNTDLTHAVNIVCDSKNYKIEKIITPDAFCRGKYRTIETTLKESNS